MKLFLIQMKLFHIGESVFVPISEGYLVYLCKKETLDSLTTAELDKLVAKTIEAAKEAAKEVKLNQKTTVAH